MKNNNSPKPIYASLFTTIVLLVIAALAFIGCSKSTTDTDSRKSTREEHLNARDVTDRSSCEGASDPQMTIYRTWHVRQLAESETSRIMFDIAFKFTNYGVLEVSNTCQMSGGQTLTATVEVPFSTADNTIRILESKSKTVTGDEDSHCSVSIDSSQAPYHFVGSCLALGNEGNASNAMVPY